MEFEAAFMAAFCLKNKAVVVLTKLEGDKYFQGRCSVDKYADEFQDLIVEAGYTKGLAIVMKFQRGLESKIQDKVAEMGMD